MDGLRVVPGGTVTAEHRLLFEEDPGRLVRLFRICQIHEARPDRALSLLVRERAHLLTPEVALSEEARIPVTPVMMRFDCVLPATSKVRIGYTLASTQRMMPVVDSAHAWWDGSPRWRRTIVSPQRPQRRSSSA
jgi:hypothetical protein